MSNHFREKRGSRQGSGSIKRDVSGQEHHWMDEVRQYKPKWRMVPKGRTPVKKIKSLEGQLPLFDKHWNSGDE